VNPVRFIPFSVLTAATMLYHNYPQAPGVNIVGGSPKGTPAEDSSSVLAEDKPAPEEEGEDDKDKKEEEDGDEDGGDGPVRPTTRSKTAPQRKKTPEPAPPKRGVFTLSDVHACRAILAEKANQHWMKGLGGGQNREGETIVNFLYKNKVGHGESCGLAGERAKLTRFSRSLAAGLQSYSCAVLVI